MKQVRLKVKVLSEVDMATHFINWDKINKKSNVVLREGEHKDLMTKVLHCHNDGIDIFMLIDEEHKYRDTANEYVANKFSETIL